MKVVHIATTLRDGAGIGTRRQHEALKSAGIDSRVVLADPVCRSEDCDLCTPRPISIWQRAARRAGFDVERAAIWERRLSRRVKRDAPNFELFSLPFARYSAETHGWVREADIVNLHWVSGLLDYPRFFASTAKPFVWTLHDQNPYSGGFHYDLDRRLNPSFDELDNAVFSLKKNALAHARMTVVGNSEWNTSAARSSGMFPEGTRFETIYYPLDCSLYHPIDKQAARAALGIPQEPWLIGFACTSLQNSRKGFSDLIEALRIVKRRRGSLALLSFGRSPSEKLLATLPIDWHHLGYLEDDDAKRVAYSAMDCFVIPSRAEAFGQTVIESLACGTTVIGADVGGIREALDQGRCGLLFPPGDISALAEQLIELAGNRPQCRACADAGQHLVAERHAPRVAAQRYIGVYEQLLATRP